MLIRPLSAIWSGIVLARIVRICGTVTLLRQSWTTRQNGAELVLGPETGTAGVLVGAGSVNSGGVVA